jgi:dienelactone hydrolase
MNGPRVIEQEIRIPSAGRQLDGLLRKPAGKGSFPGIIFVSGFGEDLHESHNSNDEISRRLIDNSFLTLQFSFAGRGKSKGDYTKMTLERQADQMEDCIAWLMRMPDVNQGRLGIHATSFGCPRQ